MVASSLVPLTAFASTGPETALCSAWTSIAGRRDANDRWRWLECDGLDWNDLGPAVGQRRSRKGLASWGPGEIQA